MRNLWTTCLGPPLMLVIAVFAAADKIDFPDGASIEGKVSSVVVADELPVKLTAPSPGILYQWKAPASVTLSSDRGKVVSVTAAPPGKLEVSVFYAVLKGKAGEEVQADEKTWTFKLVLGGVAPNPPNPIDPPKPPPDPISTSPFAEPGLRVLICFDPEALAPAGSPEHAVTHGPAKEMRDWLESHCVPDPTGKLKDGRGQPLKEWRIWPATENGQPTDVSGAPKALRDAWNNKGPEKKNWLMIGDGKKGNGAGEPLPKSPEEALVIFRKYGGP